MPKKMNSDVEPDTPPSEATKDQPSDAQEIALTSETSQEVQTMDLMSEMQEDEGKGTEDITGRDMALPFLIVLQKGSPQCEDGHDKRVDGAKPGMLMDTVLGTLYPGDKGVEVILCGSKKALVEWKDRDSGGGLVTQHSIDSDIVSRTTRDAKGKMVLGNGNVIVETVYHFLLMKDPETNLYQEMVFSMTSTFLKESRRWMSLVKMRVATVGKKSFRPPMFGQRFKITTKLTKKQNYSWYIPKIEPIQELVSDPIVYHRAKTLNKAIAKGEIQISAPPIDHSDYADTPQGDQGDDETPF